jgi:hypothetical protein
MQSTAAHSQGNIGKVEIHYKEPSIKIQYPIVREIQCYDVKREVSSLCSQELVTRPDPELVQCCLNFNGVFI